MYVDLLEEEGINSQYLAILKPRRIVDSWTLNAGSVYRNDFDYGQVIGVTVDGVELDEGSNPTLSAGEFYYDVDIERLYIRTPSSGNPSSNLVVVTFEIYCGTFDAHWYRIPDDDTTRVVYYEPIINRSPSLKQTLTDSLYGYIPVQSSSITLTNAEHIFEKHLYDSSFNKAQIQLYHWLDELDVDNIKLVLNGFMGDVSFDDGTVNIKVYDRYDAFLQGYRNPVGDNYFTSATFASIDPNSIGKPIRRVFGLVDGFVPINIDYKQNNPTTSDNRDWVVLNGQSNINDLTRTVSATPSTTTRTYVDDATGFSVGDSVYLNRVAGTDQYRTVTVVDYSSNYIEHAAIPSAMTAGDSVTRSFVGAVYIVQNNVLYTAYPGRDFSSASFAGTTSGFSFTTTLEANLSMPATLSPNDKVFCRVYGYTNFVTLGGPSFGSNDDETSNLTNPVVILFQLLKEVGIPESEINTASFVTLEASVTDKIGLAISSKSNTDFESFKDIINNILITGLFRLYLDEDAKWSLAQIEPLGASVKSIDDTEILNGSFGYDFSYQDTLSDVVVEYNVQEQSVNLSQIDFSNKVYSSSDVAKYLHKINRQKTFRSLHFKEADAQILVDRLGFIFSERSGTVQLATKNRFFNSTINNVITVNRTKLPGFDYDSDIERTRDLVILETNKNLKQITMSLDDQKGIEDNSGGW